MSHFFNRFLKPLLLVVFFAAVVASLASWVLLPQAISVDLLGDVSRSDEVIGLVVPYALINAFVILFGLFYVLYFVFGKAEKVTTEVVYVDRVLRSEKEEAQAENERLKGEQLQAFRAHWESGAPSGELGAAEGLRRICAALEAGQGILYACSEENPNSFEVVSTYAFTNVDELDLSFEWGETLGGQAAKNKKPMVVNEVPDSYHLIRSGLGEALPKALAIFPVLDEEGRVAGVLEIGSFAPFHEDLVQEIERCVQGFSVFCQKKSLQELR